MKTFILCLIVACSLLFVAAPSCTTSSKKIAYTTLAASGLTVSTALDAAAEATVRGQVSAVDQVALARLNAQWNAAYSTACSLAGFSYTNATSAELMALEKQVIATITAILAKKP